MFRFPFFDIFNPGVLELVFWIVLIVVIVKVLNSRHGGACAPACGPGGRWEAKRARMEAKMERVRARMHRKFGRGGGGGQGAPYDSSEEARVLERLVNQLDRMEQRVENLETILDRRDDEARSRRV